ncbi:MAG TPA: sugar transferase, partial [Gemmataceae bacterium]|nr:sugar transferase [Gemmataceae bacterium]
MATGYGVIPAAAQLRPATVPWPAVSAAMAAKRLGDLAVAVPLLLLCLPLFAVFAALIKIESPGPVFFRQQRRGWRFSRFLMVKFRTMRVGLPDPQPNYETLADDPRITRLGRFLRKTSIDELPQLF